MQTQAHVTRIHGGSHEFRFAHRAAGPELIACFHGLGCSKRAFSGLWDHPSFASHSLLAFDLLGFGESDAPEDFAYKMEQQARICAGVLRSVGCTRLHIVAHSMGNAVALLLPGDVLEDTYSFANVEGNLIGADCGMLSKPASELDFEAFQRHEWPALKTQIGDGATYMDLDETSAIAYHRSARSLVEWSESGKLFKKFMAFDRQSYFYGEFTRNPPDAEVDHPTERATDHPTLRLLEDVAKHVDLPLIQIAGAGHFVMNENPDHFYAQLATFVAG